MNIFSHSIIYRYDFEIFEIEFFFLFFLDSGSSFLLILIRVGVDIVHENIEISHQISLAFFLSRRFYSFLFDENGIFN